MSDEKQKSNLEARKDRVIKKYPKLQKQVEEAKTAGEVKRIVRRQFP